MNSIFKTALQKIEIYEPLLGIKRKIDHANFLSLEKKHAKKRLEFYKRFFKPGELVFDVGANIGNRTEIFLQLSAKIIAIEPQESCANTLKEKFGNSIIIEQVGLGASEGELDFFVADESTISTFSNDFIKKTGNKFSRNKWKKTIKVKVTTLDYLISKYGRPNFCKIDVEGFESEVLAGLSIPIPTISFEYCVPELADNVCRSLDKLNSLSGNYKFNYCIGESMKPEILEWMDFTNFMKLVHENEFLSTAFGDIYARLG